MKPDPTQLQDGAQQRRSQELSRQRAQPPIEVRGYEARQFLGAGAYGEVWVALDKNTGRKVAIKFYTQRSAVDWAQLSREVEKLVFLSADRHVVQLMDVGWDSDPPYYVMEYVEGGSLQQRLDDSGPLGVGEAVEMFRELATGLLRAHGKGVLHCDLKPANILLDEDNRPRLADFGQSRLSHEQTPALGTLFFMAPEQADLKAVPDARWDVYALGAMLYCMLTGTPPYRTEKLLSEIDSAPTLGSRLERYRSEIEQSPPLNGHRAVSRVDRDLAEIIDRCLAVDPDRRYPNVQSVVTALRDRDKARDRRPLLLLGLLGPLMFLLVLAAFSGNATRRSVNQSDLVLRRWALESSRFAAKFVSEAVARRIERYFRQVNQQAKDGEVAELLDRIAEDSDLQQTLAQLANSSVPETEKLLLRERLKQSPHIRRLQARVEELMTRSEESHDSVASWFVTDAHGIQLAADFRDDADAVSTIGKDYSFRNYFHGGHEDFDPDTHHELAPLNNTQLSTVFQSTATRSWKVAVSGPIRSAEIGSTSRNVGVVALTIELGWLGDEEEFSAPRGRFMALVDGRPGSRGLILQHPLFTETLKREGALPHRFQDYRVPLDGIPTSDDSVQDIQLYRDPMSAEDKKYAIHWIAARDDVRVTVSDESSGNVESKLQDTGVVVVVQEDYDLAAAPIKKLGEHLIRDALISLLIILLSLIFLWYLVTRGLRDRHDLLRRNASPSQKPPSLHSMETLEIPQRMR